MVHFIQECLRDGRIGARMLSKSPWFTIFAALVLAIAIGTNITLFSLVTAVFLRPLPVPNPDRFVRMYNHGDGSVVPRTSDYFQFRQQNQSFTNIAGYGDRSIPLAVRTDGPRTLPVDVIRPIFVSGNFIETVGIPPAFGRPLTPEDAQVTTATVIAISDEFWKEYLDEDPLVIGRTLFLSNRPFTIVAVMPPAFSAVFQTGPEGWRLPIAGFNGPMLFIPGLGNDPMMPVHVVGRLKPGISRSQAQADISRIASQVGIETKRFVSVSVVAGNTLTPPVWTVFAVVLSLFVAGVAVVLMIACDDIGIFLLARIAQRRREIGIRLALGATRMQLVRQLIAENVMLSLLGGAGAMMVALASARIIERLPLPLPLPDAFKMTFDWRVLAFATVVSLSTTVLFGMRPALQSVRRDIVVSLNPGSSLGDPSHSSVRSSLIITQVTVCTALLITAAVLVRSQHSQELPGQNIEADRVLVARVNFDGAGYDDARITDFYLRLVDRFEGTPGIVAAAVAEVDPVPSSIGLTGGTASEIWVRNDMNGSLNEAQTNNVTPGYFRTLNAAIIEGRDFTSRDRVGSIDVGIINETLAKLLWPREGPVGRVLRAADGRSIAVIGVVRDLIYTPGAERPEPFLYRALAQQRFYRSKLLVKTDGEPMAMTPLIRSKVAELDPNLLVYDTRTLEQAFGVMFIPNQVGMYAAAIPGAFAFLLGVAGTYGMMSLVVTQRRREIGIRIAIGAHPSQAAGLMLRQGMKWTAIGLGLGTSGALIMVLAMSRYFYGLAEFDWLSFAAGILLVTATAATACYLPARRASRVDPMIVLREE